MDVMKDTFLSTAINFLIYRANNKDFKLNAEVSKSLTGLCFSGLPVWIILS